MTNTIKYSVIHSEEQYTEYGKVLEELLSDDPQDPEILLEIELLTLLLKTYEAETGIVHSEEMNGLDALQYIMESESINGAALAKKLDVSRAYISDILHSKRAISKEMARKISLLFGYPLEILLRPYPISRDNVKKEKTV
ncbi:MAG: helix-turn-helix domain-containing protein [Flavobacteriales bacterium]